jgi:hypothetical protein
MGMECAQERKARKSGNVHLEKEDKMGVFSED